VASELKETGHGLLTKHTRTPRARSNTHAHAHTIVWLLVEHWAH